MSSQLNVQNDAELVLGFIVIAHYGNEGYAGGCLCTNEKGVPLEFRYTAPVQPTRLQELLYGPTLKPELFGQLIASELLKGAEHSPRAVVTDEEAILLGLQSRLAVFQIVRTPEGDQPHDQERSRQVQTPQGPIVLRWRQQGIEEFVERLCGIDLLEPLDRVKKLLSEIREMPSGTE